MPLSNLIKKIAWSFHATTGICLEELMSEATLAYLKAEKTFKTEYRCKQSTYIYQCVTNSLITFCKQEKSHSCANTDILDVQLPAAEKSPLFELLSDMPINSKDLALLVFNNPDRYICKNPKTKLVADLRELGWAHQKIWDTFKEIQIFLNNK